MVNSVGIVLIASAQSVAKAFTIGIVGYASVKFPRDNPLLPRNLVGPVSRFTFNALMLPLIYGTIARAVTLESIENYWYVICGAPVVLGISYLVATIMQCFIPIANVHDFRALRISSTFPNIVALPILIFPSLCEFPVVHQGYILRAQLGDVDFSSEELEEKCVEEANTLIFCYFFVFMFLFWGVGYPQLMGAAKLKALEYKMKSTETEVCNETESLAQEFDDSTPAPVCIDEVEFVQETKECNNAGLGDTANNDDESQENRLHGVFVNTINACRQTFTSPGFIASIVGFITACISPLQRALFEAEAPLRFLGSAIEELGTASSSMSTIIVAASLVPAKVISDDSTAEANNDNVNEGDMTPTPPIDRRTRMQSLRRSISSGSIRVIEALTRSTPEMRRLHLWFCLSRLIVTPAVVVGIVLALDCGFHLLDPVPKLALLVLIINSCFPGANMVVVLLKSKMVLEETATVVARVYFISYIVCIFTIACWTAVGLYITLPDEDGNTYCSR